MTLRILILIMLIYGYACSIIDVETAFLYGSLEEEIYMDCPPGMRNVTHENALRLIACIYGLVQAANRYHKRFVEILKSIGFEGGNVDPCLLWRKDKHGTVYVAIYVDDNFMVGDKSAIESVIRQLRAPPHNLVLKLRETFGDEVRALRRYLTPGDAEIEDGVGMLLYLIKFSRPDIANSVRELSKVLDCSTQASYKEMLRIVKYVLDTPLFGLQMKPSRERGSAWNIVCFTDKDGTLKIVFVRSEENIADIMTKNLDSSLFSRHAKELVKQK
ncbi:hypothetical protein ACHAXT_007285 [Thalassiosira profunda]